MAKTCDNPITESEWAAIPLTFGAPVMARIIGCGTRHVTNHAAELGGKKFGGKWLFTKARTAELLGID